MNWKDLWNNVRVFFESGTDEINSIVQLDGILYFIIVVIVFGAILAIYDNDNENSKIIQSISRCIRRFIILLADLAGDVISLLSSLSEVINLIRILIFGKIDSQTQILLANYAIVFLSVVSFFTTQNGLQKVVEPWQAVLASFGVQVGILVFSGRIAKKFFSGEKDNKKIYKVQCREEECNNCINECDCKNICGEFCEKCTKVAYLKQPKENDENNNTKNNNGKPDWNNLKENIIIFVAMPLLISCSMFFSYNAFWQKFVLPSVTMEEYASARIDIAEVEEEYSKALKKYQQSLEGVLQEYHNRIAEIINVSEYRDLDERINSMSEELKVVENDIEVLKAEIAAIDAIELETAINQGETTGIIEENVDIYTEESSEEYYNDLVIQLEEKEQELKEKSDLLEEESVKKNHLGYKITIALNKLSAFYADPLNADVELTEIRAIWGDLQSALAQETTATDFFTAEQKSSLDVVFSNYMELCQYYRENDYIGFQVGKADWGLLSGIVEGEKEKEQERYKEETRKMLESVISSMESVPDFEVVNVVWQDGEIKDVSKQMYLEELYVNYRECNDMVQGTEKAIRGFGNAIKNLFVEDAPISERSKWITFFVAALAMFVDIAIVLISIWKGDRSTNRSMPDIRRLVGILFIKNDSKRTEEERRMQLSLAFGLLFGVLLFVVQVLLPTKELTENSGNIWLLLAYCMCGLLVFIIIGKAIGRTQKLNEKDQENEPGEEDEEDLSGNQKYKTKKWLKEANEALSFINKWKNIQLKLDLSSYGFSDDMEERLRKNLYDSALELFDRAEWKTICVIDEKTKDIVDVRKELCVQVQDVLNAKWNVEFGILKSYQLVLVSDDGKYFMVQELFWKMLYANLLDKISGNLIVPLSVEDMLTYEGLDENK